MKPERAEIEDRIRAAIKTLLVGEPPTGMNRDTTSLCALAGVPRATMYRTYPHLKAEFEKQRLQLHETALKPDPKAERHQKLRSEMDRLQRRSAELTSKVDELEVFKSTALSRLTAQHEEILRLRSYCADGRNKVQSIR